MTEAQKEQRFEATKRSECVCAICGGSIYQYNTPQYAHKLANTTVNRQKYGSFIIDHTLNGEMVCSLDCNHVIQINHNKTEILNLLERIVEYERRKL